MESSFRELSHQKIIIAIDGFSSGGKSTFARMIADRLGYIFIDTGAMYRAVTLYAIDHGAVEHGAVNETKLLGMLDDISIEFGVDPETGTNDIYLNGEAVGNRIRSIEVNEMVSQVSSVARVREKLVAEQQQIGRNKGVVMDGRDIGTVVFPDAELKIFLTADPSVRAMRRYNELKAAGQDVSFEEIENNIRQRDLLDQQRKRSPLRKADDALVLDNSHMSLDQQMDWAMDKIEKLNSRNEN